MPGIHSLPSLIPFHPAGVTLAPEQFIQWLQTDSMLYIAEGTKELGHVLLLLLQIIFKNRKKVEGKLNRPCAVVFFPSLISGILIIAIMEI